MCVLELMDVPGEMLSSGGPYRLGIAIRMSPGHMGFTWRSIEQWEKESNKVILARSPNVTSPCRSLG